MAQRFKISLLITIVLTYCLSGVLAFADMDVNPQYKQISDNKLIMEAIAYMAQTTAAPSVDYMLTHDVKIMFKDMKEMGPMYATNDALTLITGDDHQIILISKRHTHAPAQALAAVISHEVLHNDKDNSIMEEMVAWTREYQTWQELEHQYPELSNIKMGKYPLVDRENAIVSLQHRNQLQNEIENNITYRGLPLHSPGF